MIISLFISYVFLRSVEQFDGKERKREFYAMSAADAYSILETIAEINDLKDKLHLVETTDSEIEKEIEAEEIRTKRKFTSLPKLDWLIKQGIIKIGDEVYVINHPTETATLIDIKNVNFKGEILSLNAYGCKVTGWTAIQSYAMMKIVGGTKTLSELREEKMKELGTF